MKLNNNLHLTYCTNIHSGETWDTIFQNLKTNIPQIKSLSSTSSQTANFGIGLRLSDIASREILQSNHLQLFKDWLAENNCYVFTINGFPFGNFHQERVKDAVHLPDWTTPTRLDYTLRLFDILAEILPPMMEGGISTSPLSYKLWHITEHEENATFEMATENLIQVVQHLVKIREKTGKLLHLDIEPEPDGMIENTSETIDYFNDYLLKQGARKVGEEAIRTHIRLCYDVCHFAVEYEDHVLALQAFENEGIKIGKIQISAALKANLPINLLQRQAIFEEFSTFNEPVYLHQVIARNKAHKLFNFNDLSSALRNATAADFVEWRTHFHVPIFLEKYHLLQSTQEDIVQVLTVLKQKPHLTQHLEVETYTWEVLPEEMRITISESIARELQWVENIIAVI
jgi:hypothetical protein